MSFRRLPFQFTATDPAERQRELRKQFGLPRFEDMYVDLPNSSGRDLGTRESNSASSSPRLQHRVPIFVEGSEPSVDSKNAESVKKPRIRVIPIEIEGARSPTIRKRTCSGPAGIANEENLCDKLKHREPISSVKCSMQDLSMTNNVKPPTGPRVCNIPIKIEGGQNKNSSANKVQRSTSSNKAVTGNGCNVSKTNIQLEAQKQKSEPDISIPIKKIDSILLELKSFEEAVENFTGTAKDKQYRFLDEMLTRCMLKLDDIDTMGNETVRMVRKAAVKRVQDCIDFLESKVNSVIDNQDEASKLACTNLKDFTKKGDQNVDKMGDASEVFSLNMKEVKTEFNENNVETINEKQLQVETDDVDMAACVTNIDQEMESVNQITKDDETTLRESEVSCDVKMKSDTAIEVPSALIENINQSGNTVPKAIEVSSDIHMESDIEMADKDVTEKTGEVLSCVSENAIKFQQEKISDVDMPDETVMQEQKQDKTNLTVECLPNATLNITGTTPFVNGIHHELQNKMSASIHRAGNKVCDSIKHSVPDSQCNNNDQNSNNTE